MLEQLLLFRVEVGAVLRFLLNRCCVRSFLGRWTSIYKEKALKRALEIRPLVPRLRCLFFQAAHKVEFCIEIIKEVKDKGFAHHGQAGRTKLITAMVTEHKVLQPC